VETLQLADCAAYNTYTRTVNRRWSMSVRLVNALTSLAYAVYLHCRHTQHELLATSSRTSTETRRNPTDQSLIYKNLNEGRKAVIGYDLLAKL